MRKRKKAFCMALMIVASSLGGCNKLEENINEVNQVSHEGEAISQEGNWMYLTKEQRLKDFDYLYEQLKENYPYFEVVKRKKGIDLHKQYQELRDEIAACRNDEAYFEILKRYCNIGIGHMELWGTRYNTQIGAFRHMAETDEEMKGYYDVLNNPISINNYKLMEVYYNKKQMQQSQNSVHEIIKDNKFYNVETQIIEENEIAYVKINTFDMNYYDESKKQLLSFYEAVKDYEHLIIDISENGGGGMSYFNELIAAPNIDKPLSVTTYMLVKNGENNEKHLALSKYIEEGRLKPTSEMPDLPYLIKDDLNDIDYFMPWEYTIAPMSHQKIFKGKIWMLVSGKVYSSSEYAAMFSKATGFATLVGTQTGGDGIGFDPVNIVLPESGLVVQYSPIYGLTYDGTGSEEFGTTPDIVSVDGETPLQTCLNTIHNQASQ